jgi:hypothetical protein
VPVSAARHYRRWSPDDDARLRKLWGAASLASIARRLGRSEKTTYWRARQLGLDCGAPQGFEYITAAAKRSGFTVSQLRTVLGHAAVGVLRTLSRPSDGRKSYYHYVDPFDVDQAVVKWLSAEEVYPAAERRGFCGDTLRRLLLANGLTPPTTRKARWRVDSTVIDRVVSRYLAEKSATASVREHATRVGISRATLAKHLRSAGVLGQKRPGVEVRLSPSVVDAAIGRAA